LHPLLPYFTEQLIGFVLTDSQDHQFYGSADPQEHQSKIKEIDIKNPIANTKTY